MNKMDKQYRQFYESRYTKHGFNKKRTYEDYSGKSFKDTPCYYCGDQGTTEDHIIPLVWLHGLYSQGLTVIKEKLIIVPCCRQCNGWLGSKLFNDLEERKQYVKLRIYRKYKKDLELPSWTVEEMEDIGYDLYTSIMEGLVRRKRAYQRLNW